MPFIALAEVNYYEMEGEWRREVEDVIGNPFDTVEAAKEACRLRRHDRIEWIENGSRWDGTISSGLVRFWIEPIRETRTRS